MQMWAPFFPYTVKENEKIKGLGIVILEQCHLIAVFWGVGGGSGIVKCVLTSCKVILVATYRHLSSFACPGIRGSFADGEVCLDTQSRYYDRSLSPNLVVYTCRLFKKNFLLRVSLLFLIFWIKYKFVKYHKEMLFETMEFHAANETAF